MSTATIDYDALAQQHGGTAQIDYDALAAQHGGSPSQQNAPKPQPGFWENLGHTFGIGQQEGDERLAHPIKSAVQSYPPVGLAVGAYQGLKRIGGEVAQGQNALREGNLPAAGYHALSALPFVGSAMQQMDEEAPPTTPGQSYMSKVANAATPGNIGTAVGTAAQVAPMALGGLDAAAPGRPVIPTPSPTNLAARIALLGRSPQAAYEGALKPSTTLSATDRANIVQTGLDNGIPVSKAGVEKIGDLISDLNQKISDTIASDPNRPINPSKAVQNLNATRTKFSNQVNPQSDINSINSSGQEFLDQFRSQPGGAVRNMTAQEAQNMKQGTYRVLAGKYGEQGSASVEAQKALARGLKDEIASQFPEINNLNAAESRLLNLQPVLERAVNRISNHQIIGIGTPVTGAAVKAVSGSPTLATISAVIKAVVDNPSVKSHLAISVSKGSNIPISVAMQRVSAYSKYLGLVAAEQSENSSGDNQNQPAIPQP